jgi:hypothetical protein
MKIVYLKFLFVHLQTNHIKEGKDLKGKNLLLRKLILIGNLKILLEGLLVLEKNFHYRFNLEK